MVWQNSWLVAHIAEREKINDPRPNRIDTVRKGEPESVLRDTSRWRPHNLIEPLYWLNKKPKLNKNNNNKQ